MISEIIYESYIYSDSYFFFVVCQPQLHNIYVIITKFNIIRNTTLLFYVDMYFMQKLLLISNRP